MPDIFRAFTEHGKVAAVTIMTEKECVASLAYDDGFFRSLVLGHGMTIMVRSLLAMLVTLATAAGAWASDCCSHCGCNHCKLVTRNVCEMKKETVWCYECKCEDFCVPGPSQLCGTRCVPNDCDCSRSHREFIWKPGCGTPRTRTILVKVPKVVEKPVYKCVVERVCTQCGQCTATTDSAPVPATVLK